MLKFIIKGQTIKRVDTHKLVQYAQEYPTAEFEFDEDWNGLDKTVQWNMADATYDTPIMDGTAVVPWELIRNRGTLNVNVVGITGNKVITTNTVSIDVMGCGIVGGMVSGTPSESYYNNIDKRVQINSDDIADIKENGKLKALAVAEEAVFDGKVKLKGGIKLESKETDEDEKPWQEVDISDTSGIRILSRSSESDSKRYIRIGNLKGGDGAGADDIVSGLQFCNESDDGDFYVVCGKNGDIYLIRLSVDAGIKNVIMGNETLEILSGLSGSNGYISFDSSRAGIKYTKATWTEVLKQLDVITDKGVNMEAKNNSYWWVNAEKKAQYGNSLNKLEFRTDGVAKFSNTVNASDLQIGGKPVLDTAEESSEELANIAVLDYICNTYDGNSSNKDYILNYLLDGELETAEQIQIGENVYALVGSKSIVINGSGDTYDFTDGTGDNPTTPFIDYKGNWNVYVLNGVTKLGECLFTTFNEYDKTINRLIIPNSVINIGGSCFYYNRFGIVKIKCSELDSAVFTGAIANKMLFDKNVSFVGGMSNASNFQDCQITMLSINIINPEARCFASTTIEKAEIILNGVVGVGCFDGTEITEGLISINATNDIVRFGYGTFDEVNIETTGTIGNNALGAHNSNQSIKANSLTITAQSMGQYAVEYAEIGEITLNVSEVGWYAFQYAQIEKINLCEGLKTILSGAFIQNKVVEEITIPSTVTSIATNVFDGCTELKTITVNKPVNSLTGAPWGATKATVVWTG